MIDISKYNIEYSIQYIYPSYYYFIENYKIIIDLLKYQNKSNDVEDKITRDIHNFEYMD